MTKKPASTKLTKKPLHSLCTCGHTGDGPKSQHEAFCDDPGCPEHVVAGKGRCLVRGCSCTRFTWKRFIED